MEYLYIVGCAVFGLTVGSFLNVVIYRLPVMLQRSWNKDCCELLDVEHKETATFNLAVPNSTCPHCGHKIRAWENIPVLSYLFLKGRCSGCNASISIRYPIIELITALLGIIAFIHFGLSWTTAYAIAFTWSLLVLTMIDIDHQLLPDNITLPLLWAGLLINTQSTFTSLPSAVIGATAGYLSLWSVFWLFKLVTGKEGMGYGDFKLLAALGAWMGWQDLPMIILLSSVVGAVIGVAGILIQGRDKNTPIPFGPYLAIAGWIAFMWGDDITLYYFRFMGVI